MGAWQSMTSLLRPLLQAAGCLPEVADQDPEPDLQDLARHPTGSTKQQAQKSPEAHRHSAQRVAENLTDGQETIAELGQHQQPVAVDVKPEHR